mgnify:CR=1 FL=1
MNLKDINYLKFRTLFLINTYEFLIGSLFGSVLNEISYNIIPYLPGEGFMKSLLLVTLIAGFYITILFYLREYVETLPYIKEYIDEEWFYHPSPIAMTFGFWISQNQMKFRNKNIQKYFFELVSTSKDIKYNKMMGLM